MRALRVVGIAEGGGESSVVLEDPLHRERFTVAADEQLRAAARGDLARLGQIAIELESQLRPREIQARIRAGASVEQVAAAAGVPPAKIERFAYPVLLERSRTAEVAQRAHPLRADGPDRRVLADVVSYTFGLRGQEYQAAEWDSWKGEDGRWVVALSWRAGRSDNRALWAFQPGAHGGTVTAIDEHAHDLVEGLPARPLRTVGPVIDISRPDESASVPEPEEGHELRAAASDIAARRDVGDWSRTASEPRRPDTARRGAERPRTDSAEIPSRSGRGDEPHQRTGHARPGRADETGRDQAQDGPRADSRPDSPDEPATGWSASSRPPGDQGRAAPRTREATSASRPATGAPTPATVDSAAGAEPGTPIADQPADPARLTADVPAWERAQPAMTPSATIAPGTSAAGTTAERATPETATPQTATPQTAAPEQAASDTAASDTAGSDTAASEQATSDAAAPEPAAPAPKRTRKGKPVMPSWDEVLLGVRSQR